MLACCQTRHAHIDTGISTTAPKVTNLCRTDFFEHFLPAGPGFGAASCEGDVNDAEFRAM